LSVNETTIDDFGGANANDNQGAMEINQASL